MPDSKIDVAELRGAVARGWCHPANASKEMDPDLAEAIVREVGPLLEQSQREVERLKEGQNAIGAAEREAGQFIYRRIEMLLDAKAGTPEGAELTYLAEIVSDVEEYGATGAEAQQRAPFATAHEAATPLVLYPDDGVEYGGQFSADHHAAETRVNERTAEVESRDTEIARLRAAAKDVVMAAWTDRFSRLHGHAAIAALEAALEPRQALQEGA